MEQRHSLERVDNAVPLCQTSYLLGELLLCLALLCDRISHIESCLLQQREGEQAEAASNDGSSPNQIKLKALEPGCGSARNLVWLCGRNLASAHAVPAYWEALGIDSG